MKTLALALSSIVLGATFAQVVDAQPAYGAQNERRTESAQPGAGAAGGAGGGGGMTPSDQAGAYCGSRNPSDSDRPRTTSTPPPLDPSRKVYAVDCTRPFDALGKGNLCCQ